MNDRERLSKTVSWNEVMEIRKRAVKLLKHATMAKDVQLIEEAVELKMRAEITAGEMLLRWECARHHKGGRS